MTAHQVLIYGAGGHGKVVADIVERKGDYLLRAFLDDQPDLWGRTAFGHPVIGGLDLLIAGYFRDCEVIVAIGDNDRRRNLSREIANLGYHFATALHPSAQISRDVEIGPGTVVMANAVINVGSRIGSHSIVNTAATVDHDCVVEDFCHLSPGVHLAGGVIVREGVHLGTGASAVPKVCIGRGSVVGAGGVVTRDIPAGVTAVGVPASVVKYHSRHDVEWGTPEKVLEMPTVTGDSS